MDSHPAYPILSALLAKYPRASNSLFQTYIDIVHAQQWNEVEVIDIKVCSRGVLRGRKRDGDEVLFVLPCSLSDTLSLSWLQDAFRFLFPRDSQDGDMSLPFLYLAITSSDSSIVYYKISQGMNKPPI